MGPVDTPPCTLLPPYTRVRYAAIGAMRICLEESSDGKKNDDFIKGGVVIMTRERMEIRDINFNRNTNGLKRRIATKNFCLETVWRIKFSVVSKLESIIFSLPIKINSNFILFISCLKKDKWRQDEYSYRWIGKNSKGRITDAPILSV